MAHTNEVEFPELLYQTIKEEKKKLREYAREISSAMST